jgi:hypothetical protein
LLNPTAEGVMSNKFRKLISENFGLVKTNQKEVIGFTFFWLVFGHKHEGSWKLFVLGGFQIYGNRA